MQLRPEVVTNNLQYVWLAIGNVCAYVRVCKTKLWCHYANRKLTENQCLGLPRALTELLSTVFTYCTGSRLPLAAAIVDGNRFKMEIIEKKIQNSYLVYNFETFYP